MPILSSLGHISRLTRSFVFARKGICRRRSDPSAPVLRPPLALANLIAKRDGDDWQAYPGRSIDWGRLT
jgi:hypothetical protein